MLTIIRRVAAWIVRPPRSDESTAVILDVMMPFWGRLDHFRLAVTSILKQTSADWRLTIVDDVYPDPEAGEWARSLGDDRVRYLRNETNLGPSRNYNRCVELAQSEFLVLMGCDDVAGPRYVERVLELLAAYPGADVVQPGVDVIDGDGRASRPLPDRVKALYRPGGERPTTLAGETLARSLLRGNWTYFPSLVWRRSRVSSGFRTDLDVVQDLAKLLEITRAGGTLVLDDDVVFSYRRHRGSVSARTAPDGSKFAQERVLFAEAEAECAALGWSGAARAARWHLSSRLNALSELPRARGAGARALRRHIAGPSAERPRG